MVRGCACQKAADTRSVVKDEDIEKIIEERLADESFQKYLDCGDNHQWEATHKDPVLGWGQKYSVCGCWTFVAPKH